MDGLSAGLGVGAFVPHQILEEIGEDGLQHGQHLAGTTGTWKRVKFDLVQNIVQLMCWNLIEIENRPSWFSNHARLFT